MLSTRASTASVASGSCTLALGSDGGGSIRIPASFCGLVGLKPTHGAIEDTGGFRAFSPFVSVGPLARSVADARHLYSALSAERDANPGTATPTSPRRVAWCANPEGRPVDTGVAEVASSAVDRLAGCGHRVSGVDLDFGGWEEIFGPIVLAEEGERRGHLLDGPHRLTTYQERTLRAARQLDQETVARAHSALAEYRARVDGYLRHYDVIATPATATTAFELRRRPTTIAGQRVGRLWGAFPFTAPFNVSGHPAVVLPAGFVNGLPAAVQLVGRRGADLDLLSLAGQLEAELNLRPFARLSPRIPAS